jgi:hypothetical protein
MFMMDLDVLNLMTLVDSLELALNMAKGAGIVDTVHDFVLHTRYPPVEKEKYNRERGLIWRCTCLWTGIGY